jgi:hypothetical protein
MNVQQAVDLIFGYAFLLIIFAALTQRFGFRIPAVPVIDHVALAYLAGAWWLTRK